MDTYPALTSVMFALLKSALLSSARAIRLRALVPTTHVRILLCDSVR